VKLIVGLGNPGIEYQFTPHNVGFLAVDRIADTNGAKIDNRHCRAVTGRVSLEGHSSLLAKPETFMNLSGVAVRELVDKYEADVVQDLIVIYDELDLPWGNIRVRMRGRSAGHNGVQSIINALGTEEFTRIRVGINPGHKITSGSHYVLSQFRKAQLPIVDEALDTAAEAVKVILAQGAPVAMNRFNRKVAGEAAEEGSK
jgi:peptidyl-tRNA hydrolase, PTH1 family